MELRGVRLRVQGLAAFSLGLCEEFPFGFARRVGGVAWGSCTAGDGLMVPLAPCNCDDDRLLV